MTFWQNQTGASIIQGMLLASVVAAMGYVGTRMVQDQKLAAKSAVVRNNVEQLHDMAYAILQNKDNCTATIIANGLEDDPTWSRPDTETMNAIVTRNASTGTGTNIFEVNQSATYNSSRTYMNNTVTIDSMRLIKPTGLNFANPAMFEIVYRKLDTSSNKRLGQGYGGQTTKKLLPIKIQRNLNTNKFEACYGVQTGDTDQISKDFCEKLGVEDGDPDTGMFLWDADHQQCKLKDLKCPAGEVFAGIDSTGRRRCNKIQDWMNFQDLIDTSSMSSCNPATATDVRFELTADGKVKVVCQSSPTPPTGSCSSSCDCPGMMDVCEGGVCVDRSSGACIDGTLARGDASCQFLCTGGSWSCSAFGSACGGGGTSGGHPPACCPRTGAMTSSCSTECPYDGSPTNLCPPDTMMLTCY